MCPWPPRSASCSAGSSAGSGAATGRRSRTRGGEAFDLVVQGQEALTGQGEAVLGLQLSVGDMDEDPLLEGEQLDDGQGVAFAVDRAQVVTREWELVGSGGQDEVVLSGVARQQRGGEVGAGDREADAHVAAILVPEARVDPDVDRLAGVCERPDPAADVDLLLAAEGDR